MTIKTTESTELKIKIKENLNFHGITTGIRNK